ncbi:MAG: hypothetical protein V8R80_04450 [Eubacterium sp.]
MHEFKNKNRGASYERSDLYSNLYCSGNCVDFAAGIRVWHGKKEKTEDTAQVYKPGVYTSSIQFEGQTLDVQVVVDENHINSVSLVNLDESVATMYPLVQSSMDSISQQSLKMSQWKIYRIRKKINTQQPCC